jgi:hypothetical protein
MIEQHDRTSPGGAPRAVFTYVSEIRFGPPYYSLKIDDLDLGERIFGHGSAWSDDGRFLAVQEWHNTQESLGPRTSLLILDLEKAVEARFETLHGYAVPLSFAGHVVRHDEEDWSSGSCVRIEKETDVDKIDWWEKITQQRHLNDA